GDSSPFVSQDLGSANKLTGDVFGPLEESRAAHRQAAEVMKTMQHESAEVYSTVPWFAPPKKEQPPEDRGRRPDDDAKPRTPEDPRKSDTSTSSTSGVGAVAGGGAAAGGAVGALGGGRLRRMRRGSAVVRSPGSAATRLVRPGPARR